MFRFTIRDLLWLTVVVAVTCFVCLLVAQQRRMHSKMMELEKEARRLRIFVVEGAKYELPPNTNLRATVEWENGTYSIRYEEIPQGGK